MATGSDIIDGALRKLGVLAVGASPSPDQTAAALSALNMLKSSWSYEELLLPYKQTEQFSIAGSISELSMGVSGDMHTTKPVKISAMFFRDIENVDHMLVELNDKQYASLPAKGVSINRPEAFYFETTDSDYIELATIRFDRTTLSTETLHITSLKEIAHIANAGDIIALPGPWIRGLTMNLAVDLAPEYGKPVTPELAMLAGDGKNMIQGLIKDSRDPE